MFIKAENYLKKITLLDQLQSPQAEEPDRSEHSRGKKKRCTAQPKLLKANITAE